MLRPLKRPEQELWSRDYYTVITGRVQPWCHMLFLGRSDKEVMQQNSSMKWSLSLLPVSFVVVLFNFVCDCSPLPRRIFGVFAAALSPRPPLFLGVIDLEDPPKIKSNSLPTQHCVDRGRCWKSPVTLMSAVSHRKGCDEFGAVAMAST